MNTAETQRDARRRAGQYCLAWIALATVVFLHQTTAAARANSASLAELETSVLAEDWHKITDVLLKDVTPATADPVLRLIKGHACLATNRNNESVALFASALNVPDRQAWLEWATALAEAHPNSAQALYLKGDAHARCQNWDIAKTCLDEAIQLDDQCYLAWNALGVVEHSAGMALTARVYFDKATKIKADFADGHASRGVLNVYGSNLGRNSEEGAEGAFRRAISCSRDPQPLLGTIGLGCVHYGKLEYEKAKQSFDQVPRDSKLYSLASRNSAAIEITRLQRNLQLAGKAGMSIQAMHALIESDRSSQISSSANPRPVLHSLPREWRDVLIAWNIFIGVAGPFVPPEWEPIGEPVTENTEPVREPKPRQEERPPRAENGGAGEGEIESIGISEDDRPYIVIVVHGRRKVIWIPWHIYHLLQQGKATIRIQQVGNITVVIIYVNGIPVWEVHVGPGGKIIWQGPPQKTKNSDAFDPTRRSDLGRDVDRPASLSSAPAPELAPWIDRRPIPGWAPQRDNVSVQLTMLPPIRPVTDRLALTNNRLEAALSKMPVAAAAPQVAARQEGDGAIANMSNLPTDRGQWQVCSVYGLLYAPPRHVKSGG